MPQVSIIMNVRNGAAFLREALDSVMSQTFTDWELIVWDDRSTDASAAIVSDYGDARIRYFLSPDDAPLGKARRDAILQAKAEWIAFLDQDDTWLPGKLEKQLALAEGDVALIYGRTVRFYPGGLERDYDQAHEYKLLPEGDIFTQLFTKSCFIAMSSAMFRRSAIQAIGGILCVSINVSKFLLGQQFSAVGPGVAKIFGDKERWIVIDGAREIVCFSLAREIKEI